MNVLVDTSVWSLALRRSKHKSPEADGLKELILRHRAQIIGPIRQELLSGIRDSKQLSLLEQMLRAFPDVPLSTPDFVLAAKFFNDCRARGIQASNTDFLICAVAVNHGMSIYTTDGDFRMISKHIPVQLHT